MYYGNWTCWEDVANDYEIHDQDVVVLFAAYDTPDYEGYATVVFVENGKFYYVGGSHCSCYGLEGQWVPEEMPYEALLHMATEGLGMLHDYNDEFTKSLRVVRELGIDKIGAEEAQLALKLALG